jgi:hypothetical protein
MSIRFAFFPYTLAGVEECLEFTFRKIPFPQAEILLKRGDLNRTSPAKECVDSLNKKRLIIYCTRIIDFILINYYWIQKQKGPLKILLKQQWSLLLDTSRRHRHHCHTVFSQTHSKTKQGGE